MFVEKLSEENAVVGVEEELSRGFVEADDVREHSPVGRAHRVATTRKERTIGVLEAVGLDVHAEAHRRWLGRDAEAAEQLGEVRVALLVEYDEARVDVVSAVCRLDAHRVGVASDVVVLLEDGEIVVARQKVGGDVARDPRSDDRDLHGVSPTVLACDAAAAESTSSAWTPG